LFMTSAPSSGPPVLSLDGTKLAFTARDDKGKTLVYVRALNSATAQALPGTEEAMYPFWSYDGRDLGFFAQGKLKRISIAGGPTQTICEATNGRGGAWNKDGIILFAPSVSSTLLRVSAAGGTPEIASKLESSRIENSNRWPFFLPDQKHFIFSARTSLGDAEHTIYVGTLGSFDAKPILKGATSAIYASGYLLFMRSQTLLAQPFDSKRLELSGEPIPVAERVVLNRATTVPEFSASENGTLVYQTGEAMGAWDLNWYTREGKPAGSVTEHDSFYYPALSPDESRLAVSLFNGIQGAANIWIFDLKRGTKSRLTFESGTQVSAVWSRDGKTIYYASDTKGARHIYSRPADGSGSEQTILETPDFFENPSSLSPDGRYLIYLRIQVSDPRRNVDIWALPLFGDRKPFPIVHGPFSNATPTISPTGKWIAYYNTESGRPEVYLTPFPSGGAKWQVSTNGGSDAKWRGDGKELYFLDPSDNLMAVDVDNSASAPRLGVPHTLFQAVGIQRQVGTYVVSSDGKKFLVNSGSTKEGTEPLTLVQNWPAELKR
jgi:eukaryotic-like serine/threonine-protein kinase